MYIFITVYTYKYRDRFFLGCFFVCCTISLVFFPKRDAGSEVITNNYLERGCGAAKCHGLCL